KGPNPLACVVSDLLLEQGEESILHRRSILVEEHKQVRRESLGPVAAFNNIQDSPQFVGKRSFRDTRLYPAIENVSGELALKYCRRVQEASGRLHEPL